jgi:hypothetical protein
MAGPSGFLTLIQSRDGRPCAPQRPIRQAVEQLLLSSMPMVQEITVINSSSVRGIGSLRNLHLVVMHE